MIKRQGYKYKIPKKARKRIENNQCPSCGKPKSKWKRRTDWRCCSTKCTADYEDNIVERFYWASIKKKALVRDSYKCVKCGKEGTESSLISDHIKPIALGGEEFNVDNVQTLCIDCDKIKTKEDAKRIAKQRRIEKVLKKNKRLVL